MSKSYEDYERVSVVEFWFLQNHAVLLSSNFETHTHSTRVTHHHSVQDYQSYLSRIRSFLASTRSNSTLLECERLLREAHKSVTAMQAMAAVEGNVLRTQESQNLVRQDLKPLQEEVARSLRGGTANAAADIEQVNREDLFYQPPTPTGGQSLTTQSLIQNSEDLLRESQA
jgi:hypothetical protein